MISQDTFKKIVKKIGTPVFIYEEEKLTSNVKRILDAAEKFDLKDRVKVYVSYFCNSNPYLFKIFKNFGIGILLQDEEEYYQVKKHKLTKDIIVSPSFLSDEEIDFWVKNKIKVNLASLEEIEYLTEKFKNEPLCFRIDLTENSEQRMGVKRHQLSGLSELLKGKNIIPHSVHIYIGTGSSLGKMKANLSEILKIYKSYFSEVKNINLGGGFAFEYEEKEWDKKHFDWQNYFSFLKEKISEFEIPNDTNFMFEPGRDIFADAGQFLIKTKRVVDANSFKNLSTDGSYVFMPSATVRTRQHGLKFYNKNFEELFASNMDGVLSGCTTLSSDYVFPGKVKIPNNLEAGDFIVVNDIGAYGATQHMEFLNKRPCPEVLIAKNGSLYLITQRGANDDKLRNLVKKPKKI